LSFYAIAMKILVQVKAGAKVEKVEIVNKFHNYKVWVKAPAKEGKANEAVVKVLAKHFKVPKSSIEILSGFKYKKKVIQIIK